MSQEKPIVTLWVLGELDLRRKWYEQIKSTKVEYEQMRFIEYDSPERAYRLLFRPGAPTHIHGIIWLTSFDAIISVYQRGLLLLASRLTPNVYVLLCNTKGQPESEDDDEERDLRDELSAVGFSGNDTFFLHEPEALPTQETVDRFFDELDRHDELTHPQQAIKPPPTKHRDKDAHDQLDAVRNLVLPVAYFSLVRSTPEALFRRPISTQFGGMPYLEAGEEWPTCGYCSINNQKEKRSPLRFVWQIDAHHDLLPKIKDAGLYTFYTCGELTHPRDELDFTIRYYPDPQPSKRQPIREESKLAFGKTNQPISPCSIKKELDLQIPNSWSFINQEELYPEILNLLGKDSLGRYHTISQELCVSQVAFSFTNPTPLQIGGYSDPGEYSLPPTCDTCGKALRTLANIHFAKGMWFPWGFYAFQFFLCPCTPNKIHTTTRSRFSEDRYDSGFE